MSGENFVDYVKICCRSGKGGPGSAHFMRNRMTAKGGPDGGDGGRGGHIIIRGNQQHWTLLHLKYSRHVIAAHGEPGRGQHKHGSNGKDAYIDVPLGTVIRDAETEENRRRDFGGTVKSLSSHQADEVVWGTIILNRLFANHPRMRNPGKTEGRSGRFWN